MSEPSQTPRIGVDEWVASAEARRARSLVGRAEDALERVPPVVKLVALALPFAVYPLLADTDYLVQVGIDTLIFVLLVLGYTTGVWG